MDDIIYFLLLVGWLAFSFYQQNAKKKKKLEQMRAEEARRHQDTGESQSEHNRYMESQDEAMQRPGAETKTDFKSTIEEWLLGEQISMENIDDAETQMRESISEENEAGNWNDGFSDDKKPNVYQKYYDEEIAEQAAADYNPDPEKIEDKLEELEEAMVLEEDDILEGAVSEQQTNFDLRSAVIYSEILNRRY